MYVVTLARKPVDKASVTANVIEHGSGVLNIAACRLHTEDNLDGGAYSPGGRAALPGDVRRGAAAGMFVEGGGRLPGQYRQPSGRWPANLILSHAPGCECVGTKRVKASAPGGRPSRGAPVSHGPVFTNYSRKRTNPAMVRYADEDGLEAVVAWECIPGCPVAALDQSGVYGYGDAGGVSRFFKQVGGSE